MSENLIPFLAAIELVRPQPWRAEPKATLSLSHLTFHLSLNSGSAYASIRLLNSLIILSIFCWTSWGVSLSSFMSLSTLFMKRSGLTLSSRACLVTVSV